MISRRDSLRLLTMGGLALLLQGHAPYRQWIAYRKDHLMIVASRQEPEAYSLGKAVAEALARSVPEARPQATRAPTLRRVHRLINSRQIDVAVVTGEQARLMLRGEGEGAADGPVPLRTIAFLRDGHALVCHAALERDRAYLLAFGLFDEGGSDALAREARTARQAVQRSDEVRVPLHEGALDFYLELEQGGPAAEG